MFMSIGFVEIKPNLLKAISEIAKDEGTDEKTIINDFLTEAVEDYNDCELLEKIKQADNEFKDGKSIRLDVDGFNKRYGL